MNNMKRIVLLVLVSILFCSSCGKKTASATNVKSNSKTVNDVIAENTGNANTGSDANHGGNVVNPNDKSNIVAPNIQGGVINGGSNLKRSNNNSKQINASDIDIDLTRLSSTMVYSEVYNMMNEPEKYVGKTIRMDGNLAVYKYPERNYYTCIIQDATACCQQGMEFLWAGNHKYPDDYPNEGDGIIVTGVFDIYYEGENKYCQLKDASLVRTRS